MAVTHMQVLHHVLHWHASPDRWARDMTPSGKSLLWEMRRGRLSKMAKTVYVPRFGSQLHGSQTNEPKEYLIDLPPTCTQKKQYENCLSSKKGQFTRSRNYVKNKQTNNENESEASPIGLLQYSCRSVSQTRRALDCEKEESKSTSQGMVCLHWAIV